MYASHMRVLGVEKAVPPIGDKCHVILLSAYSATCQVPNRIASDIHTLLRNNLSITKYGQGLDSTQQLHHVAHCKNPKSILTFHSQLKLLLSSSTPSLASSLRKQPSALGARQMCVGELQ